MAEISIERTIYELLVRQSEQLHIIERMLIENEYVTTNDIRIIMGVPKRKEVKDA